MSSAATPTSGITGLDVGGAHLKVARVDGDGRMISAVQLPCALWQGLDRLEAALDAAAIAGPVAVTMTGELADLFPDRATGVRRLVEVLARLPGPVSFWAGRRGFLDAAGAMARPSTIASANWLATGMLAASRADAGLLVDIGSTTTDLLVLAGGRPRPRGSSDRSRLTHGELVYTGFTRTSLMALAAELPFRGRRVPLMREHFATTADVWRILGLLPKETDQHEPADGGPKSVEASARRLARMIGADLADGSEADWRRLAEAVAEEQESLILRAIRLQLSRGLLDDAGPLIVAGSGAFIGRRLAGRLGRKAVAFAELVEATPQAAASIDTCAPAVAVALLASSA